MTPEEREEIIRPLLSRLSSHEQALEVLVGIMQLVSMTVPNLYPNDTEGRVNFLKTFADVLHAVSRPEFVQSVMEEEAARASATHEGSEAIN